MESLASKIGAVLVLLAISSVAAVGVFMPEEEEPQAGEPLTAPAQSTSSAAPQMPQIPLPRSTKPSVPQTVKVPGNAAPPANATSQVNAEQQAYALAYELARQRVKTVAGLTRQQRLDTAREALARLQGGNVSGLDAAATLALAKQAPDPVKDAAIRGVSHGEARGISVQSQLLVERMLIRETHPKPQPTAR